MSRGYQDISVNDRENLSLEAIHGVIGAKLLKVRTGRNDTSGTLFLEFDNGKVLRLEGEYDEGVDVYLE